MIGFGVLGGALLFERLTGTCCLEIVAEIPTGIVVCAHAPAPGVASIVDRLVANGNDRTP